jgi:hypothetical protein
MIPIQTESSWMTSKLRRRTGDESRGALYR